MPQKDPLGGIERSRYALRRPLPGVAFDDAVERITARLQEEGFGILTTIDVQGTLKQKLDVDFRRYVILGACNPGLAHRALGGELEVGLLLPCNVVVYETPEGSVVTIADPEAMMRTTDNAALEPLAAEARERLEGALGRLTEDPADAEC